MTSFFYGGITYTDEDISPLVEALTADPAELPAYQEAALSLIDNLLNMQAYASAQEAFTVMCRVLAATHTALGHNIMAPR